MKYSIVILLLLGLFASCNSQTKATDATATTTEKVKKVDRNTGILSIEEYNQREKNEYTDYAVATFAGGCFWCMEGCFECIKGVKDVISGYAGGELPRPTYDEVGRKQTNHAETIQIYYNPKEITYKKLLEILFVAHDPTQVNGQGPDIGKPYRSMIFYHDAKQKEAIADFFAQEAPKLEKQIATEVVPYKEFWVAEDYHQDYYWLHPDNAYVQKESVRRVTNVERAFPDLIVKNCKQ